MTLAAPSASALSATLPDPPNNTRAESTQRMVIREGELEINGRTTPVFKVILDAGERVIRAREGDRLRIELVNESSLPTSMHPHGLILPNAQDGVPFVTQLPVPPGGTLIYDFVPVQSGSYFFHSHYGWQLQDQLAVPIVIEPRSARIARSPASADGHESEGEGKGDSVVEAIEAAQDVVMMLTDLLLRSPPEVFAELRAKSMSGVAPLPGAKEPAAPGDDMKDMKEMKGMEHGASGEASKPAPDLNDVDYDAVLANGRPISNAEVVRAAPGYLVRLRLINASSSTNFTACFGGLTGTLVAVDGEPIEPLPIESAELAIAQRMDVLLRMPEREAAVPVLAQGEGSTLVAAIVLATPGAAIPQLPPQATKPSGAIGVGYRQERLLRPLRRLSPREVDRTLDVTLDGRMAGYEWNLSGGRWPDGPRFSVKEGERVEMVFTNRTMMSHPMHLHGHVFQVVEIDGRKIDGAMRDTILVMPGTTVKVQFDADNPGLWMMHCHITWHEAAGMLAVIEYEGVPKPEWYLSEDTFSLPSSLPRR
ncbi:MAG: multicopper oxidase family protein [Phycisphaeraceae bacterium]|nr:multicopper oxidase family protein [Phycisphaeraceae bacterium]